MSRFDIKSLYTSPTFLQDVLRRFDAAPIGDNPFQPIVQNAGTINEVASLQQPTPCWDTQWQSFPGNAFYFNDTPTDLPITGKWKYRLPIIYDTSKKTLQVPNVTYPNVSSIKIEDKSKGVFRANDHYFVRSNGEVWVKGSRPYLYLSVIVNWQGIDGGKNTTRVDIPPDDFILNGELVSISRDKVRVPYRPCYKGFEAIYNVRDYTLKFYRKYCEPTPLRMLNGSIMPFNQTTYPQYQFLWDNTVIDQNVNPNLDYPGVYREGIFAYVYDTIDLGPTRVTSSARPGELGYFAGYVDVDNNYQRIGRLQYLGGTKVADFLTTDYSVISTGATYYKSILFVSAALETRITQIKEYTQQARFSDLLDCECIELNVITPPTVNAFLTENCDCTVTVSEEIYIICPDKFTEKAYDEYLYGRQTPPTIDDLIDKEVGTGELEPTYRRIITADPCDFGDDSSRVWQQFARRDIRDVVKNEVDGLFDGQETMSCYATSSVQSVSTKPYYYDVTDCNICEVSKSYFSVSFGHYAGSGSLFESFEDEDSPSRSIFSQYRLKNLDSFSDNFEYYKNATMYSSSMIYVMTFNRDSMKDRIDPGNFQINLSELTGNLYSNNVHTGSNVAVSSSNKVLSLVDNSGDLTEIQSCGDKNTMYSFDIVSGSLANGIHSTGTGTPESNTTYKTYGKVYPNAGVIVLDASLLDSELNFNTVTGSNIAGDNSYKIFTSLSGSASIGMSSKFRNSRQRNIRNYSVRIAPVECNVSNNPTYLKENGRLKHACFIDNPVTYITSVGLYDPNRQLLAVAKLSKPIKKTKDDTVDIKIRLGL
jgi:hypothetical protein